MQRTYDEIKLCRFWISPSSLNVYTTISMFQYERLAIEIVVYYDLCAFIWQDKPRAEFSTKELAISMKCTDHAVPTNMT